MTTLADIQAGLEAVEIQMETITVAMARLYTSATQRMIDGPGSRDWSELRDRIGDMKQKLSESKHQIMKTADWIHEIK